jgi:hypothetical protein
MISKTTPEFVVCLRGCRNLCERRGWSYSESSPHFQGSRPFVFRIGCRHRVIGEMTLGTAQLGMDYGVANRTGKPPREIATAIVRAAIAHGVTVLDTARAYGDSEEVLRAALRWVVAVTSRGS